MEAGYLPPLRRLVAVPVSQKLRKFEKAGRELRTIEGYSLLLRAGRV